MVVKRISERVAAPFAGAAVDRDRGIIRCVKLCGGTSVNGREYPAEVFRRDVLKYEGAAIYADHGRDRSVDRKLGWIAAARVDADGTPRGDAHLLRTHPLFDRVMEAAERNPAMFGFSHVALCETSYGADGRERVEGLRAIESVDLVAEPATTRGLFEGRTTESKGGCSLARLVERISRDPAASLSQIIAVRKLAELDDGAYADASLPGHAMDADTLEPAEAITAGFKAALLSVIEKALMGELDSNAAIKKIKSLLSAHRDAATEAGNDEPEPSASESRGARYRAAERPTSTSREQAARLSEHSARGEAIPEGGQAFARWVAE